MTCRKDIRCSVRSFDREPDQIVNQHITRMLPEAPISVQSIGRRWRRCRTAGSTLGRQFYGRALAVVSQVHLPAPPLVGATWDRLTRQNVRYGGGETPVGRCGFISPEERCRLDTIRPPTGE